MANGSPPESTSRPNTGAVNREEAQRVEDMLAEGGGVVEPHVPLSDEMKSSNLQSTAERPQGKITGWLEDFAQRWGAAHLSTLVQKKGRVSHTMKAVPEGMHRVANQTRLVLELIDDFRDGTYRDVSWRSVALVTAGILYSVNPADVIPDTVPLIGQLDDLVLLAVVTRLVHGDLRKYCRFKGYKESDYFRSGRVREGELTSPTPRQVPSTV
jgi:uncharacterized membrane protein YkvA (DUF1232 family)